MVGNEAMNSQMKFRLSAEMKEQIMEYCEKHNMSVSEFLRFACNKIFQQEG